jgi:DNA mismatch endonuclease (patch repair protein)
MDTLTPRERSERMSRVRNQGSKAEKTVRRLVHGMGYRFRLHVAEVPGKPDLVFPSRRKVIFVHGCFWHRHDCKNGRRLPKSRLDFWLPKLEANRERDSRVQQTLKSLSWDVLIVWECMTRDQEGLRGLLRKFLDQA